MQDVGPVIKNCRNGLSGKRRLERSWMGRKLLHKNPLKSKSQATSDVRRTRSAKTSHSCRNSHASLFLQSPGSQCLQMAAKRSLSRGWVGVISAVRRFLGDGAVCRSERSMGPRRQLVGVNASRHIRSSATGGGGDFATQIELADRSHTAFG